MRFIAGIDPGLTGAIVILDFETYQMHVWDTPVSIVKMSGGQQRKRPEPEGFVNILTSQPVDYCMIENVHSTPNDGHVGAFTFGKVTGIAIGVAHGLDIPLAQVTPAKWKYAMQVPAVKEAAKQRASELFPHCTAGWGRVSDHGRAEAAIIALYAAVLCDLKPMKAFTLASVNGAEPKAKKAAA